MLVISRHRNEVLCIGNDIRVVIVDIRGDKVRLGIEAPQVVPVHRKEVYDAIHRSQAAVANGKEDDTDATDMTSVPATDRPSFSHSARK